MGSVDEDLGVGEVVQGCDGSVLNSEVFVNNLDSWGYTVSGA